MFDLMYLVEIDPIVMGVIHFHCCHQVVVQDALGQVIIAESHQLVEIDCFVYVICSGPYVGFHQLVEAGHFLSCFGGETLASEGGEGCDGYLGLIGS